MRDMVRKQSHDSYTNRWVQGVLERCNSSALAMELRLCCTNPSEWFPPKYFNLQVYTKITRGAISWGFEVWYVFLAYHFSSALLSKIENSLSILIHRVALELPKHYDVKSQSFNPGLQYPHLHGPVHTPDNNRWDTPPV